MIPTDWVAPATPYGLCALFTFLIVRGYLVPPRLVHRQEYDRVKAERDEAWAAMMRLLEQNQQLLAAARVVVQAGESPTTDGQGVT